MWYNAANTSKTNKWFGNISAGDLGGNIGRTNASIGVSELLALGVDNLLSFGARSAAANDSTISASYTLNLYNYGNVEMDFQVNGTKMQCGSGDFGTPDWLHVNLTNGDQYSWAYPLSTTLGNSAYLRNFFNLNSNITATAETPMPPVKPTYWGIGIPPAVSGGCQATIWFAAVLS